LPKNSFTHCGKVFDWDCVFQFWVYDNGHIHSNINTKRKTLTRGDRGDRGDVRDVRELPFKFVPGRKTSCDIWITSWGKVGSKHMAGTLTTR
jgi:hypothetical protein